MPRNLINVEAATVAFGFDPVLHEVSLGVAAGDRIGIVGRNGGGKSTLLAVIGGALQPDGGRVSHTGGIRVGFLGQQPTDRLTRTIADAVIGSAPEHEWAADARAREVAASLLGITTVDDPLWHRTIGELSGGERRRVELASLLVRDLDILLLDEPTNHLDVEAVSWLADHLRARRHLAVLVVTHDRWFLDAVTDRTWEVVGGDVAEYEGGYSAFVLAKAERMRQADAAEARRRNLMRKELAWLRRGPPARTSKPKFRIDAANALIADEPPPRDASELLRFAGSRLGKSVVDLEEVTVARGDRNVLVDLTWGIGPGERVAIFGPNGAGKSTLARVLSGALEPDAGRVSIGSTVMCAVLSQQLDELRPTWRVLEAVEDVARYVQLADGGTLSASQLAERLGFGPQRQWTPVGELSGGERRRLQLTRLLMGEPNVLILDEPTNDFDVETLAALEDLLDSFAGTLVVITHDRYFAERVCDTSVALFGDGGVQDLPGGVEQYLQQRQQQATPLKSQVAENGVAAHASASAINTASVAGEVVPGTSSSVRTSAQARQLRKDIERIERTLQKLHTDQQRLHEELAAHATDPDAVRTLDGQLQAVTARIDDLEQQWLDLAEDLD